MKLHAFKTAHGIAVHEHQGHGYRYAWTAYFDPIRTADGTARSFVWLVHRHSWDYLAARRKWAEGEDEESACRELARLNGIEWPSAVKESLTTPRSGRTVQAKL